jgi:hypothetical protein
LIIFIFHILNISFHHFSLITCYLIIPLIFLVFCLNRSKLDILGLKFFFNIFNKRFKLNSLVFTFKNVHFVGLFIFTKLLQIIEQIRVVLSQFENFIFFNFYYLLHLSYFMTTIFNSCSHIIFLSKIRDL